VKLSDYEYFKTDLGVLYYGDCLEILSLIEDKVDLVLTDPPYNASKSKIKHKQTGYKAINEKWDIAFDAKFIKYINANQELIFCSHHSLSLYLNRTPKQILHWIKNNPMFSVSGKTYMYSVEYILWYVNGSPYIFNLPKQRKDCFFYNKIVGSDKRRTEHPTQKPIELIIDLINIHSNNNDLILDPFLGSGTTAVACEKLGRRWIGIEISEKYCEIAKQRIKAEADQFKMEFA